MGSPQTAPSFRPCPPALLWGSPKAAPQAAPAQSSPCAAGDFLLWCLEHLLPSFFSDFGTCRTLSHPSFFPLTPLSLSQHTCTAFFFFYPFLNLHSQMHHTCALPWVRWGWLEAAGAVSAASATTNTLTPTLDTQGKSL